MGGAGKQTFINLVGLINYCPPIWDTVFVLVFLQYFKHTDRSRNRTSWSQCTLYLPHLCHSQRLRTV